MPNREKMPNSKIRIKDIMPNETSKMTKIEKNDNLRMFGMSNREKMPSAVSKITQKSYTHNAQMPCLFSNFKNILKINHCRWTGRLKAMDLMFHYVSIKKQFFGAILKLCILIKYS